MFLSFLQYPSNLELFVRTSMTTLQTGSANISFGIPLKMSQHCTSCLHPPKSPQIMGTLAINLENDSPRNIIKTRNNNNNLEIF